VARQVGGDEADQEGEQEPLSQVHAEPRWAVGTDRETHDRTVREYFFTMAGSFIWKGSLQ
jgi:hypothetical protein